MPEDVQQLARRQVYELSDNRWSDDCRKLAGVLKPLVKRHHRINTRIAAAILTAALLIADGYGVKSWYDRQSEFARKEAEAKQKAEQERIAQEQAAQTQAAQKEAEKKRLAQEEAQRQSAIIEAENSSRAASESASSAAKYAADAAAYAARVATAAAAAERYRMPTRISNETIKTVQAAVVDAGAAVGRARDAARSAQEAAARAQTSAAKAAQTTDKGAAALDARAAAAQASQASKTALQEFQSTKASADTAARGLVELREAKAAYDSRNQVAKQPGGTPVDSFVLLAVAPPTTTVLQPGKANLPLSASVQYTLASVDRAIMAIYLEQYPDSAGGCSGATHRTNGSAYMAIRRGANNVKLVVRWPGSGGAGYLSVGINLWEDVGGRPGKLLRSFGIFTRYCYRVEP